MPKGSLNNSQKDNILIPVLTKFHSKIASILFQEPFSFHLAIDFHNCDMSIFLKCTYHIITLLKNVTSYCL